MNRVQRWCLLFVCYFYKLFTTFIEEWCNHCYKDIKLRLLIIGFEFVTVGSKSSYYRMISWFIFVSETWPRGSFPIISHKTTLKHVWSIWTIMTSIYVNIGRFILIIVGYSTLDWQESIFYRINSSIHQNQLRTKINSSIPSDRKIYQPVDALPLKIPYSNFG